MTVLPTFTLSGRDELLRLPVPDDREVPVTVVLPEEQASGEFSKLVTMDKLVGNKWAEPSPHQRLLATTSHLLAYTTIAKNNTPIVKITQKEGMDKKTVVKNIQGAILTFMFKAQGISSTEDRPDETFALLSLEGTSLRLYAYDICLTTTGDLRNNLQCERLLSDDVPAGITPVLAVQPGDPETTAIAVAVDSTVYFVSLRDDEDFVLKNFRLGVTSPIVSMHLASNEECTLAACTRDGTLVFYNPCDEEEMGEPYKIFESDCETVNWTGFADNIEDAERVWESIIVATDCRIIIFDLQNWVYTYNLELKHPLNQMVTPYMRYSMDPRGKFLVLSSQNSSLLYILELGTTHHHKPDIFSRMFSYPVKSGIFDLALSEVTQQSDNVVGRYQEHTEANTLTLLGITNCAMNRYHAVFDCTFQSSAISQINTSFQSSITSPLVHNLRANARMEEGVAASSGTPSPAPSKPLLLLSPDHFTSSAELANSTAFLPNRPEVPESSVRSGAGEAEPGARASVDTPRATPQSRELESDEALMPTPLPTPAGRGEENVVLDIIDSICHMDERECGVEQVRLAEEYDALLYSCVTLNAGTGDLVERFLEVYTREGGEQLHPVVKYRVSCKHLLRAYKTPGSIARVVQKQPELGEELVGILNDTCRTLLSSPNWHLALAHFQGLRKLVEELYYSPILVDGELMRDMLLRLYERLVKSYYEIMEEEEAELIQMWEIFVRTNVGELTEVVKQTYSHDSEFLIKVRDVLEPLKDALPGEYCKLESPPTEEVEMLGASGGVRGNESGQELLKMLRSSGAPPLTGTATETQYKDVLSLMYYFDNTRKPDVDEVTDITRQIIQHTGSDAETSIATEIVNNYHSKDWYDSVITSLCDNIPEICSAFEDALSSRVSKWLENFDPGHSKRRGKELPSVSALIPGHYRYSWGSSPLSFYVSSLLNQQLRQLIDMTLSSVLPPSPATDVADDVTVPVPLPRPDQLVACYHGYRSWKRGKVVTVHGADDIRVFLIDSGQVVDTNTSCIRPLSLFTGVPPKCHIVRLAWVVCPEEHSDNSIREFKDLVEEEELRVTRVSRDNDVTSVSVVLSDGINLAEALYRRGLVAWSVEGRREVETDITEQESLPNTDVCSEMLGASPSSSLECLLLVIRAARLLGVDVCRNTQPESSDEEAILSGDSSKSSVAAITSPDEPSSPQPETRSVATVKPQPTKPASPVLNKPSSPIVARQALSPIATRPAAPYSIAVDSEEQAVIPKFSSLSLNERPSDQSGIGFSSSDIREKGKISSAPYIDTTKTISLGDITGGLEKAIKDVTKLQERVDLREARNALENKLSTVPDYDVELGKCASIFFDNAKDIFGAHIQKFYQEEVIDKLQAERHQMTEKIVSEVNKTMREKKMKEKIEKDVTDMVKEVNSQVQEAISSQLSTDKALQTLITKTLLPSFKNQLDAVYRSFDNTLQVELEHHIRHAPTGRSDDEVMNDLEKLEGLLSNYEKSQASAKRSMSYTCGKLEQDLMRAAEQLYTRHGITSPH